jgi:hypothetical protein
MSCTIIVPFFEFSSSRIRTGHDTQSCQRHSSSMIHRNDNQSKAMCHRMTRVSSSTNSELNRARQPILNSIRQHLNAYELPDACKQSTYQNIHHKFSASMSPSVYRHFQRIYV